MNKTCSKCYEEVIANIVHREAFIRGYITGQAEKVFLGACPAAVFTADNDSNIDRQTLLLIIIDIAKRYQLSMHTFSDQIWICRDMFVWCKINDLYNSSTITINSPEWHRIRAELCGIPEDEIDEKYHEQ